jgi:hypothetical protein
VHQINPYKTRTLIYYYATSFCVNCVFLIARGTRLKHERSEGFKALRAIRKAQFTQKPVPYKILLFETTSLKLPNLFKMVSHLLLTVLTIFSRSVRNVTLNVLSNACFTRSKKLMNFLTLNLLLRVIHKIVVNKLTTIN